MNTALNYDVDVIDAPDFAESTRSGRVTWDERGNGIWEWQTAPGVFSRDISLQQLHALSTELTVVDEVQPQLPVWTRRKSATSSEMVMSSRQPPHPGNAFEGFLKRLGVPA